MKGDYEEGQIVDLIQKRKRINSRRKDLAFATATSSVFALIGASTMLTNATVAGGVWTLAGLAAAGASLGKSISDKNELMNIRRKIESYQKALRNKGVEPDVNPERKYEDEESLAIFSIFNDEGENPEKVQAPSLRKRR